MMIDLLTHAQRHVTTPGSFAHAGKCCREGQLIAAQAAVAHAGAPLEDGALHLTVGDLGWRRARHGCRQKKREISAHALSKSRNEACYTCSVRVCVCVMFKHCQKEK